MEFFLLGGFFFPVAILGLLILGIVVVVMGRNEPDPHAQRAYTIYLISVKFVALFTVLFAVFTVVNALAQLVFDVTREPEFYTASSGEMDPQDQQIRRLVASLLTGAALGGVLWFHHKRLEEVLSAPDFASGPGRRTYIAYLYFTCFVALLTAVLAAVVAAYALVTLVAPETFGEDRSQAGADLVSAATLAVGAGVIFLWHWKRAARWRTTDAAPTVTGP